MIILIIDKYINYEIQSYQQSSQSNNKHALIWISVKNPVRNKQCSLAPKITSAELDKFPSKDGYWTSIELENCAYFAVGLL